jgi:hypothetical protein
MCSPYHKHGVLRVTFQNSPVCSPDLSSEAEWPAAEVEGNTSVGDDSSIFLLIHRRSNRDYVAKTVYFIVDVQFTYED